MSAGIHTVAVVVLTWLTATLAWASPSAPGQPDGPVAVTVPWPCRLVVPQPLREIVEEAWQHSTVFRRQCRELAEARTVVVLSLRTRFGRGSQADTVIGVGDAGVVVATVSVPLESRTVELIAHELEHVVERAVGVDLLRESRRRGSRVWRTFSGFETQRAIDAGREAGREVREAARMRRASPDLNSTTHPALVPIVCKSSLSPQLSAWPCRLILAEELRPVFTIGWKHSATLRAQCQRLAEAQAFVFLHVLRSRARWLAEASIGVTTDGVVVARAGVPLDERTLELISHELEHVIERIEGANLAIQANRSRSLTSPSTSVTELPGGAFETQRAIDTGLRRFGGQEGGTAASDN